MSKRYDADFKAELVRLVVEGAGTIDEVADQRGVSRKTLVGWIEKTKAASDPEPVDNPVDNPVDDEPEPFVRRVIDAWPKVR